MRVLVCGDRNWSDREFVFDHLQMVPPDTVIIHGNCRGADKLADSVARQLRLTVIPFPAKWRKFGHAAGPIRNEQMINEGRPDKVLAFHDHLDKSRGTRDMIDRAESVNIPVRILTHNGD